MEDNNYLMEKKIEYLIDMKLGKLKDEIVEAMGKVSLMSEEMTVLKNKVERLNLGVSLPRTDPQTRLVPQTNAQTAPAPKPEPINQGGQLFSPEDVSVEKMFYFGNK